MWYQKELHKICFQYDMAYGYFKDFSWRTASDEILHDKGFNIARNQKCDRYQSGPLSNVSNFGVAVKNEIMQNKQLAEELGKPIIRKFEKREVSLSFIDNIWGANLAGMQFISKFNQGICFLLSIINIYSNYDWVIPLKHKKRHYNY